MNTQTISTDFFDRVAARCPSMDRETLHRGVHAALLHLRRRLPLDAERHLLDALPGDARALSTTRDLEADFRSGTRHIEPLDRSEFVGRIRLEGGLDSDADAALVARAVLATIVDFLPADESMHIRSQLPPGMKQLWTEAVKKEKPASPDMQELLYAVESGFTPRNGRQMLKAIDSTVIHFLHRFGFGEEKEMLRFIPEEIRIDIGHLELPSKEVGRQAESLTVDEFIDTVRKEAGLPDRDSADRAVHAVLRGMKALAAPRVTDIADKLPREWRTLWIQA